MVSSIIRLIQAVRGSPIKIFDNVIRNLLDSWLDSKVADFILEIPAYQIRKACVTGNKEFTIGGLIEGSDTIRNRVDGFSYTNLRITESVGISRNTNR